MNNPNALNELQEAPRTGSTTGGTHIHDLKIPDCVNGALKRPVEKKQPNYDGAIVWWTVGMFLTGIPIGVLLAVLIR